MSKIFVSALFATSAAAQLTTSIWIPGGSNSNVAFVASVIEQNGDQTTLSLDLAGGPATDEDYYYEAPKTVTVGGSTSVAYAATASDPFGVDPNVAYTISLACSRQDAKAVPTCVMSTKGADQIISALCSAAASQSHATPLEGEQYCTDPAALTTVHTYTLSGESADYINNFPLTITDGTEKLTAAATPTGSAARSTGSVSAASSASGSRTPASTGSIRPSAASSGSAAQQSTGAAPMITLAPLAGLGAAAAALFL